MWVISHKKAVEVVVKKMTAHIHTDELDFYKATVCEGMRKQTGTN